MNIFVFGGALGLVALGYAAARWRMASGSGRKPWGWMITAAILMPIGLLGLIASSDRLFFSAVPLEQRLVSPNEAIRKRAEQDLLGLSSAEKRDVARRLIPTLSQEGDPFPRKWASIALALMGPAAQEALPVLLQCVSDQQPDVAQACRVAVTELGTPGPDQLPALLQSLEDPREAVRCEAAESIAKMGPAADPAVSILMTQVKHDAPPPACMITALSNLSQFLPAITDQLRAALHDPRAAVRRHALQIFAVIGPRTPVLAQALLEQLAQETDPEARVLAAKALTLRQVPEPGPAATYLYALRRARREEVRLAALQSLRQGNVAGPAVLPSLIEALEDPNVEVRLGALQWLCDMDLQARPATNAFLRLLRDPDPRVRRGALEGLRRVVVRRKDALPQIAKAQRDADPMVRCLAAQQLVEMGAWDRVAISFLVADLKARSDNFSCAAQALAQTGRFNRDVAPALVKMLHDPDRLVRSRAATVLLELGGKGREAIPALVQAEKDQIPGAEAALRAVREGIPRSSRNRGR